MSTFEERALSAGAALRQAFLQDVTEGDPVSTTTRTTSTPSGRAAVPTATPPRRPRRGRDALLAAAAALIVAGGAVGTVALTADGSGDGDVLTPAEPPAPAPAPATLEGLREIPDYPISMTVPPSLREVDEDAGSRAFVAVDGGMSAGGLVITALRSVDGVDAAALPADVASEIADRSDLQVTDVGTTTIAGVTGQSFRLTQRPGEGRRDLWCPIQEPLCFKVAPGMTTDVVVLPTSPAPLWVSVEYTPQGKDLVLAAAADLLASLEL